MENIKVEILITDAKKDGNMKSKTLSAKAFFLVGGILWHLHVFKVKKMQIRPGDIKSRSVHLIENSVKKAEKNVSKEVKNQHPLFLHINPH